jgi:hypothetical protein
VPLASTGFHDTVGALVELVRGHLGNPATRADPSADLVPAAVEAMLRHVLPGPQRRMGNDQVVARVVAGELGDRGWLRFIATGNLPGRPNGSAVVWLTAEHLVVADLSPELRPTGAQDRARLPGVDQLWTRPDRRGTPRPRPLLAFGLIRIGR